jgi:amidase
LISQQGIIPIAHSQDTAGPIARTVTDAAILLNSMVTPFGRVAGSRPPSDYTVFLQRGALNGARIGIDRRQFLPEYFALPELNAVVEQAIEVMASLGAVIVDPVDTGDPFAFFDHEFTVLLYEFKVDIANYLSTLGGTRMRILSDLIAFNLEHCEEEMTSLDQFIFELAEATSGDLTDPVYREARSVCLQLARDEGIRSVMREHELDAVVSPSYAFGSCAPAVAGFPSISVPVGIATTGWPAGIWMYGGFLEEHKLLAYSYGPRTRNAAPNSANVPEPGSLAAPAARHMWRRDFHNEFDAERASGPSGNRGAGAQPGLIDPAEEHRYPPQR